MKEVDIVVGIPSFNEEDNISFVTRKVDEGLTKHFPNFKSIIINADESTDKTKENFLKTKTKTTKKYFHVRGVGKGLNILKILDFALKCKAKFIFTIDADVTSTKPIWVKKFLTPLIKGKVDFVTPLYVRNRYEANTTNHFCSPILEAAFSLSIMQPIAGEYSFTKKFAEFISQQERFAEIQKYGIDIFLTGHAASMGFKMKEIYMGKKLHKPSFGKMVPIFQQMATTTFYVIGKYRNVILKKKKIRSTKISSKRVVIADKFSKPSDETILERRFFALKNLNQIYKKYKTKIPIKKYLVNKIKKTPKIGKKVWVEILYEFLKHALNREIGVVEARKLSEIIIPFFLLRVLTYFEEIEKKKPAEIEKIIEYQKSLLKFKMSKLNTKYPS